MRGRIAFCWEGGKYNETAILELLCSHELQGTVILEVLCTSSKEPLRLRIINVVM